MSSEPLFLVSFIYEIEGTSLGSRVALWLALLAAFLHAVFGALQKGRHDPWLSRGAIDASSGLAMVPLAIFVVPIPEPRLWPIFLVIFLIHFIYKLLQAFAYSKGSFTVVYPVVRGTSPIFTVFGAYILFGETFSLTQWLGVLLLLVGIFGLALYNLIYLEKSRETLPVALIFAVCTGSFVAIYTTIDAYGIRLAIDPLAFIVWFFLFDSLSITPYAIYRWFNLIERPNLFPLAIRGVAGGIVAFFSFGSIMLATRLDKVGEAAVLRETSTVFAAIIGWVFLKETVGPRRVLLMALIAFGAVVVELGG
ncbi:MAG: multidrug transporter [Rhodobacterales bacterium]|jgi:drug/metabolite transporter (DMT)-like permease|nr:multidrug transporter [Rhodobacterales bacterium]NCW06575.1 multidrug transporter [Rhodobacterales bacterium]NCX53851.1 multidrug transporter [Rhodobacterales bacterium]NDA29464.1 multidrug transporter [Alphaproteobacteria bacterium]